MNARHAEFAACLQPVQDRVLRSLTIPHAAAVLATRETASRACSVTLGSTKTSLALRHVCPAKYAARLRPLQDPAQQAQLWMVLPVNATQATLAMASPAPCVHWGHTGLWQEDALDAEYAVLLQRLQAHAVQVQQTMTLHVHATLAIQEMVLPASGVQKGSMLQALAHHGVIHASNAAHLLQCQGLAQQALRRTE
jgi:hypothetical protein